MNLADLKGLLGTYKLECAGNKLVILEQLIVFSGNPDMWNQCIV